MDWGLNFKISPLPFSMTHKDKTVLLGSCFSDEMATQMRTGGFTIASNPFGTLFHPLAIANILKSTLEKDQKVEVYQSNDLFFSWDAAGVVYETSEEGLVRKVLSLRKQLLQEISEAKLLVITFGTAWGYRHREKNFTVGNCHKAPSSFFKKELSTIHAMEDSWKTILSELWTLNPNLEVVFTVSPVRHKKDGLVENNRSKARLLELVHHLTDQCSAHYFPAYEILIDELRDYRFYSEDLVHPNSIAVEYIWRRFSDSILDLETKNTVEKVVKFKRSLAHKSLHPESEMNKKRVENLNAQIKEFMTNHPEVYWGDSL